MKHRHVIFLADNGKLYSVIVPAWIRFDGARSYLTPFEIEAATYQPSDPFAGPYDTVQWTADRWVRNPLFFTIATRQSVYARLYPSAHTRRLDNYELPAGLPDVAFGDIDISLPEIIGGERLKFAQGDYALAPTKTYFTTENRFSSLRGNFPYMHGRDSDGVYFEFPLIPVNAMESFSRTPFNTSTITQTIGTVDVPFTDNKIPPVAPLGDIERSMTNPDTGAEAIYTIANVGSVAHNIPIVRLYEDGTQKTIARTLAGQKHTITAAAKQQYGTQTPSTTDSQTGTSINGSSGNTYELPTGNNPTGAKLAGGGMDGCFIQDITSKLNSLTTYTYQYFIANADPQFSGALVPAPSTVTNFLAGTRADRTGTATAGFMDFWDYIDYALFPTRSSYVRAQSYNVGWNPNYLNADFTYGTIVPSITSSIVDMIRGAFYERFVVGGATWRPSGTVDDLWQGINIPLSINDIIKELFWDSSSASATVSTILSQAGCTAASAPSTTVNVFIEPELEWRIDTRRVDGVRSVVYTPRVRVKRDPPGEFRGFNVNLGAFGVDYLESGADETITTTAVLSQNSFESVSYDDGGVPVDYVTDGVVAQWQQDNVIYERTHGTLYAPNSDNTSTIGGITVPANKKHCVDWFVADGVTYTVAAWDNEVRVSVDGTETWAGKLDEFLPPDLFARVDGATPWQHYRFLLEQHPTATGALEFAFETALDVLNPTDNDGNTTVLPERELEDTWERVIVTLRPAFEDEAKETNANSDECPVKATILPTFDFRTLDNYLHNNQLRPWMITDTTSYTYPDSIYNTTTFESVNVNQNKLVFENTGGLWLNNVNPPQTGTLETSIFYESFDQNGYYVFLRDIFVFYEGDSTGLSISGYTRYDVDLYGYDDTTPAVKLAVFTLDVVDEFAPQDFVVINAPNSSVVGVAALEDYYEVTA